MPDGFLILVHFLTFTFGFTALILISAKSRRVPAAITKPFFSQALFYNLTIVFMAIANITFYISGKGIVNNRLRFGFYDLIVNINNLLYILWCLSFVFLIYRMLGKAPSRRVKTLLYLSGMIFLSFIIYNYIGTLRLDNSLFQVVTSEILCFTPVYVLGYSVFLLISAKKVTDNQKRKAMKAFGLMFVFFPLLLFCYYTDSFFLHLMPDSINHLAINVIDFCYNTLIVIWSISHFESMGADEVKAAIVDLTAHELIQKYQISKRELEIIQLVCSGRSNQEIADELFISLGTVKNHLYNIFIKLGIKNRTQLVKMF
jgi:DNA-binding CsgD family transcriptional regulator